jgi:hypothetical protein
LQQSDITIGIYDMVGSEYLKTQQILHQPPGEHQEILQTANLPKGVYIITLNTKEGIMSKRLIKN